MFGRRPEGKRVKHLDPIVQITPYLMPWRCDAQVFLAYDAEYEPLLRYMSHKSREGVKITFMELIIAAYVRSISQVPEANRFIMNRKFYNRTELAVSFVVLRPTEDGQPEENAVKVKFDPSDTIFEVSARVKQTIEEGRRTDDDSAAIKLASALLKVPLLPNLVVHVANFLDHHDLFPKALMDALPFHTSLFVTNMASIGMTRVYHHIYNFGDTTMFLSLGCPERSHAVDATGKDPAHGHDRGRAHLRRRGVRPAVCVHEALSETPGGAGSAPGQGVLQRGRGISCAQAGQRSAAPFRHSERIIKISAVG